MSDLEVVVGGQRIGPSEGRPADGWTFTWIDEAHGVAQLARDGRRATLLVEGGGSDWVVTLRGRRVPVTVRTWRERMLAEAEVATRAHGGPLEVRATLPGLIVAVEVEEGSEVAAGGQLLTIEAMKMQNEVRAPRDGRVTAIAVAAGQTVAKGALLLRIE
ncbi:MAG TPA: biotin/lipoyl-containing protein [Candidatus Limnocylindria bacterium]|jgi:biotin carboxyl carrier protein|nr:biotin/lipoyl-containing protein [Candidatus Limnocylindria bacterium]